MKKVSNNPKGGGKTTNRQGIYSKFEPHAGKAIAVLVEAMERGNWAVKVGAAKIILAKLVPDLKAVEYDDSKKEPLVIKFVDEKYLVHHNNKESYP